MPTLEDRMESYVAEVATITEKCEDSSATQEAEGRSKQLHERLVDALVDIRDSAYAAEVPEEFMLTHRTELKWRLNHAIQGTVELMENTLGRMVITEASNESPEYVGTEITGLSMKFFERVNS